MTSFAQVAEDFADLVSTQGYNQQLFTATFTNQKGKTINQIINVPPGLEVPAVQFKDWEDVDFNDTHFEIWSLDGQLLVPHANLDGARFSLGREFTADEFQSGSEGMWAGHPNFEIPEHYIPAGEFIVRCTLENYSGGLRNVGCSLQTTGTNRVTSLPVSTEAEMRAVVYDVLNDENLLGLDAKIKAISDGTGGQ